MSVMEELRLEDPVFEREELAVARPSQSWTLVVGLAGAGLLGLVVFWQLSASRLGDQTEASVEATPQTELSRPQVPLQFESAQRASDMGLGDLLDEPEAFEPMPMQMPMAAPVENASVPMAARIASPALVIDLSQAASAGTTSAGPVPTITDLGSANEAGGGSFLANGSQTSRAEALPNQGYTIVEGAVIPAVLETAINSDLPGYVRAIVSHDVRSFDGANVLIPQGSRLVGQYRSSTSLGQSRAFVIWTRVIRPDGVSVRLDAPSTDTLGRGGLEGDVDRHFLQRFGGALLLSFINLGGALASGDHDTQVVIGSATNAANSAASQALQSDLSIRPTLTVPHGASIRVFVNRDLDFSVLNEAG